MSNSNNNTLTFSIPSSTSSTPHKILLHQAANADEDQGLAETNTGFVMWPSAVMLSHHISKNPSIVLGDENSPEGDVMELGAGCGLVGLTAATLLQQQQQNASNNSGDNTEETTNEDKVIFTDYNSVVLENLQKNIELNDFDVDHKVLGLDWFDQEEHQEQQQQQQQAQQQADDGSSDDTTGQESNTTTTTTWIDVEGNEHAQVRLILGADLLVCTNDADLVASTIDSALVDGGKAFILGADQYTRFGVQNFPDACRQLGLHVTVQEDLLETNFAAEEVDGEVLHERLMEELELGGYNQRAATMAHDFTFFKITKPIAKAAA